MKKNILVTTLGKTWELLPEILGFTNPDDIPFYHNHPNLKEFERIRKHYKLEPVSEVWLITTEAKEAQDAVAECKKWLHRMTSVISIHSFRIKGLCDIHSVDDCRKMKNLIYGTVLKAHEEAAGGQVILSLAGGFKTMSSDMQNAAQIFGCQALLHVFMETSKDGSRTGLKTDSKTGFGEEVYQAISSEKVKSIQPIVVSGKKQKAEYLNIAKDITSEKYSVSYDLATDIDFLLDKRLDDLQNQAESVLSNFTQMEGCSIGQENFQALFRLHPLLIDKLRKEKIGSDVKNEELDRKWLLRLPKAELHCHFGGILSPEAMIRVACEESERIQECADFNEDFSEWLSYIEKLVETEDVDRLREIVSDKQKIRKPFPGLPEPVGVCGFLSEFKDKTDLLEKVIYGKYLKPEEFSNIKIENYERLGDLQGSALMQSECCIRAACRFIKEQCAQHNILYLELRCSPINYTRGGLTGKKVVEIILDELVPCQKTYFTLIFIASRHGKMSDIYRHIELAQDLLGSGSSSSELKGFRERFVGFDLAGVEGARSPKELRDAFEELHKQCLNLTIHAGESADAESIWEAVYYLNADRIGHGLKLLDREDLLNRFIDHHIPIEMCPSSNFQICNFKDPFLAGNGEKDSYPLGEYLKRGLAVTVNTDDPGISRTDFTHEYLKAAHMTDGGLSRWDILQLIKNSFSAAFTKLEKRRELLSEAERKIMKIIKDDYESR